MKKPAQTLSEDKVQQMFALYCSVPKFTYVSRVARVHVSTVKKYWEEGEWEVRRQKIVDEARKSFDMDIVSATKSSLAMIQRAKEKLEQKVHELTMKEMNPAFLVSDIEKLVKLEQLLLGGVGDRKEIISTTHEERIRRLRESREKDITPKPRELTSH